MVAALIDTLYLAGKEEKCFLIPLRMALCQKALPGFRLYSPTAEYPWREKWFNSTVTSGRALKGIFKVVSLVLSTDP